MNRISIEHLDLAFNYMVGCDGVELIASVLHETALKSLDLHTTGVQERGLTALALALQLDHTHIEHLNIAHNQVGSADAHLVEAAKKHSKLSHINDEGTHMKDDTSLHGHALRTLLKGECFATKWTPWSKCAGECGDTNKVRNACVSL